MRILQLLPARPSEYEKKCQRIDPELLRSEHDVVCGGRVNADETLDYGRPPISELPEAVELWRFGVAQAIPPAAAGRIARATLRVASFRRKSIIPLVEQTMVRLHRTREDIEWLLL